MSSTLDAPNNIQFNTTSSRLEDKNPPPNLLPEDLPALAARTGDATLPSPAKLPARQPKVAQARHAESSVYPYLETNVDSLAMSFSAEPIPSQRSQLSIAKHGSDTPFRSHAVIRGYVESLVRRNGYERLVSYNTSVELAEKVGEEWRLVLRKEGEDGADDEWWEERFDAVVVASGHFNVPYIPHIEGLAELERAHPGTVKHSKMFRGREAFRGKVIASTTTHSHAELTFPTENRHRRRLRLRRRHRLRPHHHRPVPHLRRNPRPQGKRLLRRRCLPPPLHRAETLHLAHHLFPRPTRRHRALHRRHLRAQR